MKFRTPIDITPFCERVEYKDKIMAIGSCFASEIGGRLRFSKFDVELNPTGVLFNTASICSTLQRLCSGKMVLREELQHSEGVWFHYDFHSSLSATDAESALSKINSAIECGHRAIKSADWVVITLGTAWIYRLAQSGEVVANCHKRPHKIFSRHRQSVAEVVSLLTHLIEAIIPEKKVILTLSPVRHLGDGLSENSLSKATLRVAIDEVVSQYAHRVHYFPAYEILLDDLRDYRFYSEDMSHPSPVAIDYVWERFCQTAISHDSQQIMARVVKIMQAMNHRPLSPGSEAYIKFCKDQLLKISQVEECVNMDAEKEYFRSVVER